MKSLHTRNRSRSLHEDAYCLLAIAEVERNDRVLANIRTALEVVYTRFGVANLKYVDRVGATNVTEPEWISGNLA